MDQIIETRLVVPTGGYERIDLELVPKEGGQARLKTAASSGAGPIDIVGGQHPDWSRTEARVYEQFLACVSPKAAKRISLVEATARCTARDMLKYAFVASRFLQEGQTITVVTYPLHNWRCRWTLRWAFLLRGRWPKLFGLDSNENAHYSIVQEVILLVVTLIDPFWIWIGLPFVWLANRRVNE